MPPPRSPIPPAEAGLVVRYSYLWKREADQGRDNSKARPACIVAAIARRPSDELTVILLPISINLRRQRFPRSRYRST